MNITIYECEEKATTTGKKLKKVTLQMEGKQYPYKFVTVWENHPEYDKIAPGFKLQGELQEKDAEKINPNTNKPYKNRTLQPLTNPNGTTIPPQDHTIGPRLTSLENWAKTQGYATEAAPAAEQPDYPSDEIDPDSIPF
jgi:hypothetical protein